MPAFHLTYTLIVIAAVILVVLTFVAYLILAERKVAAWVQDRLGPNRVGPWGLLQPLADGGKMFLKEEVIPAHVDKVFFLLAPMVSFTTALLAIAVVPFGSTTPPLSAAPTIARPATTPGTSSTAVGAFEGEQGYYATRFTFAIAPGLDIGLLYVFALGSLAVYGVILAGWSANSKYSLLGSLRSSAQIISYEIPLGLSVVGVALVAGSLNLEAIVDYQARPGNSYFALTQPLAFLLFLISVFAECNRLPFDLPESEQELVGGYHTEYSSLKLGMLLLAEYAHMITVSLLLAVVFWGGWHFPELTGSSDDLRYDPTTTALLRLVVLLVKMSLFIGLFLLVRWTIPRFRFDQLMGLAWKVLIPLALLNLVCVMLVKQFALPMWVLTAASVVLFVGAGAIGLLTGGTVSNPRRRVARIMPNAPSMTHQ
jgi:NADH-quinone oxidoreductase subunit H